MMNDRVIIEIQKAKDNVKVVPVAEGSTLYKIVSDDKVITENLTREQADNLVKQAKDRVILG